MDLNDAVGNV
jgi:hypothetical protein